MTLPIVIGSGSDYQNAIYFSRGSHWPLTADGWESRARETLERGAADYVDGGASSEATMRANREAFDRCRLRPRMLVGTRERDLSVDVLGLRSPVPFLLAPIGVLSIVHPDAERAVARASQATGVPFVLSSAASTSMEDLAAEAPGAPRWFQLYWFNDRAITASLVSRAAEAGYGAIVVTLDTLTLGWRPRDLENGYLPFIDGHGFAQFYSDPVFRSLLDDPPEDDPQAAALRALVTFPNLGLTWDDLDWLREQTELPILVKGVLRGDDALLALDHGVDGIVVSNHGGRQVDGAVAALDALAEVRGAAGPEVPVLMDSGIRTGSDVLKALALGADAVLLGRPYVHGLAVGGQEGVEQVVRQLAADLDLACALAGVPVARDADRSLLVP